MAENDTPPTGHPGQLMRIGYVAAMNISQSLGKPELAGEIEQAIKDEINAMSSHFTLAFADIQADNERNLGKLKADHDAFVAEVKAREAAAVAEFKAAVGEIKSTFRYVSENRLTVGAVLVATLALGVILGRFVA